MVINEYGGMEGLATVEDIVEEIVGEIEDEFDEEGVLPIRQISQNTYIVSGNTSIRYWQEYFDVEIENQEFDTLGGFVTFLLEHIPKEGESVRYENFEFIVKGLKKGKRINQVLVRKITTDRETRECKDR